MLLLLHSRAVSHSDNAVKDATTFGRFLVLLVHTKVIFYWGGEMLRSIGPLLGLSGQGNG